MLPAFIYAIGKFNLQHNHAIYAACRGKNWALDTKCLGNFTSPFRRRHHAQPHWLVVGGLVGRGRGVSFSATALSALPTPDASWLALPVGTLATLIPSTPGYVGTFDYFIVQAMTALNNPVTAATAYALLVHMVLWLPPTLIGGLYLLLKPTPLLIPGKST